METTNPYQSPLQVSLPSSAVPEDERDNEPDEPFVSRRWIVAGALVCAIPSGILGAYANWFFSDPHWADMPQYYTPPTTAELVFGCTVFAVLFGVPAGVCGAILGVVFYRMRSLLREIMK